MLKTISILSFVGQLLTSQAANIVVPAEQTTTCRECAVDSQKSTWQNWMCKPEGAALPTDKSVVCCRPTVYADDGTTVVTQGNQDEAYCKASATNKCSGAFESRKETWYSFCPQATAENCGGQLVLPGLEEAQTWGHSTLRYAVNDPNFDKTKWKNPPPPAQNDVCHWTINAQLWKLKTAQIVVTFKKIDPGMNLGLYGQEGDSDNVSPSSLIKSLVPDGQQIIIDTPYKVDATKYNFTIIAVPSINSVDTSVEFTFQVEGEEYVYWEKFFEYVKNGGDPDMWIWIWAGSQALIFILMGVLFGCCCSRMCNKSNSVGADNVQIVTRNDYENNAVAAEPIALNNQSYNPESHNSIDRDGTQLQDMESIDSDSKQHGYQRNNGYQRGGQQNNYANPFSKKSQQRY